MSNDGRRWANMPPSSSGLGHLSFKEATGIRLPLGVGYYKGSFLYHVLPKSRITKKLQMGSSWVWVDARAVNGDGL